MLLHPAVLTQKRAITDYANNSNSGRNICFCFIFKLDLDTRVKLLICENEGIYFFEALHSIIYCIVACACFNESQLKLLDMQETRHNSINTSKEPLQHRTRYKNIFFRNKQLN